MPPAVTRSLAQTHPRELKGIVKDIPTLPVIYQQLFRLMQDPNVSVPQLAEVISRDQSLTAKILHLVNSAFYGQQKQIRTISRAVVILGFQSVRSAALATSVFDYFKEESAEGRAGVQGFWEHSIAVASICKTLAGIAEIKVAEEAFVVGLLHDIGKLITKKYFPADFAQLVAHLGDTGMDWYGAEKQLFPVNHAVIGKAVFRAWNFPDSVVEAIHLHHSPTSGASHPQLVSLVHVADILAYHFGRGSPFGACPALCDPEALALLRTDEEILLGRRDDFEPEITRAMSILQLTE